MWVKLVSAHCGMAMQEVRPGGDLKSTAKQVSLVSLCGSMSCHRLGGHATLASPFTAVMHCELLKLPTASFTDIRWLQAMAAYTC
jgi:hypothetical protein